MHEGGRDRKGPKVLDPYHWIQDMDELTENKFKFME